MNNERPVEVTRAVQLLYASFAIGFLNTFATIAFKSSGKMIVMGMVILIPLFSLAALLIYKISQGKNSARIVILITVLLAIIFAIPNSIKQLQANIISGILIILVYVLQILATYLLFRRNSNTWFKSLNQEKDAENSTSMLNLD